MDAGIFCIGDYVIRLDGYMYIATKDGNFIAKAGSIPELLEQLGM